MATKKVKTEPTVQVKDSVFSLTQAQVSAIDALFGGGVIKTGEELVDKLTRSQSVRLLADDKGIVITLSIDDLHALKQQSIGMGQDFDTYVREFCEDAINLQLNGCYVSRGF